LEIRAGAGGGSQSRNAHDKICRGFLLTAGEKLFAWPARKAHFSKRVIAVRPRGELSWFRFDCVQ
jgi:hypothetical protein